MSLFKNEENFPKILLSRYPLRAHFQNCITFPVITNYNKENEITEISLYLSRLRPEKVTSDAEKEKKIISIVKNKARGWLWVGDSVCETDTDIGDKSERG